MAKSKKSSTMNSKKSSRKSGSPRKPSPTRKSATPSKSSRKPAGKSGARAPRNPSPISTGSGATAGQVGRDIVAMFNAGKLREIEEKYWAPGVVSIEGEGVALAWSGRKAVEEKNAGWSATHRMHGASAEGPYVGASGFAIKFAIDVEDTSNGSRTLMEEVGVYTIQNGKIVREEFMYGKMTPIGGQPASA